MIFQRLKLMDYNSIEIEKDQIWYEKHQDRLVRILYVDKINKAVCYIEYPSLDIIKYIAINLFQFHYQYLGVAENKSILDVIFKVEGKTLEETLDMKGNK